MAGRRWNARPHAGAQIDWGCPVTKGLLAYWPMTENAGSARDLVAGRLMRPNTFQLLLAQQSIGAGE